MTLYDLYLNDLDSNENTMYILDVLGLDNDVKSLTAIKFKDIPLEFHSMEIEFFSIEGKGNNHEVLTAIKEEKIKDDIQRRLSLYSLYR